MAQHRFPPYERAEHTARSFPPELCAVPVALNAGTAAELSCGYWLIVADDAIAQGEADTAPIMALVGGNAVTVKPKAATPKVAKHVLEDSAAAWQKAADATVADDLYWRLSATVPAGLPPTTPTRCSSSTL